MIGNTDLIEFYKRSKLFVRGPISVYQFFAFANLAAANVNVRSHTGVAHDFHHKYLIVDANSIKPTVISPVDLAEDNSYAFELQVNDGFCSSYDTINVIIKIRYTSIVNH